MEPKVGVGVFIIKDKKVLFGKRLAKHAHNKWAPPGGHLEFGETSFECAMREVREETGMKVEPVKNLFFTQDMFPKKHYITLWVLAKVVEGEPSVMEPKKCAGWHWYDVDSLPTPMMLSTQNAVDVIDWDEAFSALED